MGECLYIQFWKEEMPFIKKTISSGKNNQKVIDIENLQSYSHDGNRKTLRFRITIQNGIATTKTNSAIARDLVSVINDDPQISVISKGKTIVINLLNGDTLNVSLD
ncbi:MAG: hypothetical protein HDR88_16875 [Bacteroides sp.]|nr:hypothetical protein [Bacteroides sp.]